MRLPSLMPAVEGDDVPLASVAVVNADAIAPRLQSPTPAVVELEGDALSRPCAFSSPTPAIEDDDAPNGNTAVVDAVPNTGHAASFTARTLSLPPHDPWPHADPDVGWPCRPVRQPGRAWVREWRLQRRRPEDPSL
jgi:hypothetical protein